MSVKTRDQHWFDLFAARGTRRDFLRVGSSAAALVALGSLPGCGLGRSVRFNSTPSGLGVASGAPTPDGVVLWARLGGEALAEVGAASVPVEVGWEISEDESFSRIVQTGTSDALPALGHSVHAEVDGLRPGRDYFYRWTSGGVLSPVGRTKTAPAIGAANDRFDFAFVSCQHYEHGFFTALEHLSNEDVDLIVHLGDYIYEGAATDDRPRRHEGPEATTLQGYRNRYSTYRRDPQLQAAHAAAPWVATSDDHEVDNNYAGVWPEDDQSRESFLLRRAAAYQAFYEFLPLRRTSMPSGPDMRLFRRLRFGNLLDMRVLDTRQYRDDQPCEASIGPTCAEHFEEGRSILGSAQREWLFNGLATSEARWNVLAQQVLMTRFQSRDNSDAVTWQMDKWDGYPLEREALIGVLADTGASNPIVLTGDIHSNWVARLARDFDDEQSPAIATEFAGTSLTSGGNGQAMTGWGSAALRYNPHVDFYNYQRGYVLASVTPDRWTSTFRIVPVVQEPGGAVETLAVFVVEDGRPGAIRV